jgi:peptidoglycan/LPS O-acetylase OafA/YrhL
MIGTRRWSIRVTSADPAASGVAPATNPNREHSCTEHHPNALLVSQISVGGHIMDAVSHPCGHGPLRRICRAATIQKFGAPTLPRYRWRESGRNYGSMMMLTIFAVCWSYTMMAVQGKAQHRAPPADSKGSFRRKNEHELPPNKVLPKTGSVSFLMFAVRAFALIVLRSLSLLAEFLPSRLSVCLQALALSVWSVFLLSQSTRTQRLG